MKKSVSGVSDYWYLDLVINNKSKLYMSNGNTTLAVKV